MMTARKPDFVLKKIAAHESECWDNTGAQGHQYVDDASKA
jgi:hypothetical protein